MKAQSIVWLVLLAGAAFILAGCPGKGKMMKGSLDDQARQVEKVI